MKHLFTWIPTYSQFNLKLCHGVEAKAAMHVCSSCRTWTRCVRGAFRVHPMRNASIIFLPSLPSVDYLHKNINEMPHKVDWHRINQIKGKPQ
ncbi:hypothetical protein CY34DRAFT_476716 [Suillus luteus UH-Slu-Lm8-n1]|uniref:Uncharacterized protein n=1 Tax=Suillus luteus UH-Slu-Lm8-n1 TaxID=930992 RepID=A0A0C9ZI93_9AGAM|nr:hypothetical protein CY34DRAFT_476716 [Suillus luteus UH-Slu-Lm8-n1]